MRKVCGKQTIRIAVDFNAGFDIERIPSRRGTGISFQIKSVRTVKIHCGILFYVYNSLTGDKESHSAAGSVVAKVINRAGRKIDSP